MDLQRKAVIVGGSNGLGLALCKTIIEAHGGVITLTDNDPAGCCFTFSLPAEEVTINE